MSQDDQPDDVSTRARLRRYAGLAGMIVVVLVLAAGAAIIGAPATVSAADAPEYLLDFYQGQDVEGFLDVVAPGTVEPEQLPLLAQQLGQVLRPDVQVATTTEHTIEGEAITEIRTTDLQAWCVDESGAIYLRCKMGEAPVIVDAGGVPIEPTIHQVDVFVDRSELVLGFEATADGVGFGPLELAGSGSAAEVQLGQSAVSADGQLVPADPAAVTLDTGQTLLLLYVGDTGSFATEQFDLTWDGNGLTVDVGRVEWFV